VVFVADKSQCNQAGKPKDRAGELTFHLAERCLSEKKKIVPKPIDKSAWKRKKVVSCKSRPAIMPAAKYKERRPSARMATGICLLIYWPRFQLSRILWILNFGVRTKGLLRPAYPCSTAIEL